MLSRTMRVALQDDDDGDRLVAEGGVDKKKGGLLGPRKEVDYDFFVERIWPTITTKKEKQMMTAPMVWQVLILVSILRLLTWLIPLALCHSQIVHLSTCTADTCTPSAARHRVARSCTAFSFGKRPCASKYIRTLGISHGALYMLIICAVLQEFCSFLKGSSEAMNSPTGKLSLEAYLEVHGHLLSLIGNFLSSLTTLLQTVAW